MRWSDAKAELEKIAGDRSNTLKIDDWTFTHYDPPQREITFSASVQVGDKFVSSEGKSLRFVLDSIKAKLGIGDEADPTDEIPDDENQAAAI
jgi:hypothetical protein